MQTTIHIFQTFWSWSINAYSTTQLTVKRRQILYELSIKKMQHHSSVSLAPLGLRTCLTTSMFSHFQHHQNAIWKQFRT